MLDFVTFLKESEDQKKSVLNHLNHIDRLHLTGGHEGAGMTERHLMGLHKKLIGKDHNDIQASTKYDGAPSIIFGNHPDNGQFFVSTKSAHNKNPKINYTEEDIDRNHGHAPGLAAKLKNALKYLPGIMPRKGGQFQGDYMHDPEMVTKSKGMVEAQPNTIKYKAPANSAEGANMLKQLGIVVHTQDALHNARPVDPKTRASFKDHPHVNNIDPTIDINPNNYSPEEQKNFLAHMQKARKIYSSMKPEALDALEGHGGNLEAHITHSVKNNYEPSVEGVKQSITDKLNKKLSTLSTQAAKDRYIAQHAKDIEHITNNHEHFDKALKLHQNLRNAKDTLLGVMAKNNPYAHEVNGEQSGPEGTVVFDKNGGSSKLVPYSFSGANLNTGKFQKGS